MALSSFIEKLKLSIQNNTFVKLSLGNYKGTEPNLKNIYAKPVIIKREFKISFTYRYKTKDITKNMLVDDAIDFIAKQLSSSSFHIGTLFTTAENGIIERNKKGDWSFKSTAPTVLQATTLTHDIPKIRKVGDTSKKYLQELRLTDKDGKVFKNAQDKWKQINHYIELLHTELKSLPRKDVLKVVDMGAGKGYLTFALHDYLVSELKLNTITEGIEYRDDLVDLCNDIAQKANFTSLSFLQGTIDSYVPQTHIDVLIALHACDTATDDAIFKGIQHHAELIVVAPCCHKQVRKQLEMNKIKNNLSFMTQYGIFLERHAEMLTDSIRSLVLEYYGYQTKVIQFISDAHTPKNVMIIGVKKGINKNRQEEIRQQLVDINAYFGLNHHYLVKMCNIL